MGEAAALPPVERRPGTALRALILLGRLALGGMFFYAAYTKLRHPWMLFAFSVSSYQLLPEWAVVAVARTVPWFELGLGLLLITDKFQILNSFFFQMTPDWLYRLL